MADKKKRAPRRQAGTKVKKHSGDSRPLNPDEVVLYGIHAVKAALANKNRRFVKIFTTRNAAERLSVELEARGQSGGTMSPPTCAY